ncbi:PREDICTED: vesicle-associated membrane protein 3-like [Amphimedon queenslandica]|uniref:V-SNARE coiled-coil homology domain-containing protein n=1 Tax=Amphimedon queenslandica TaxID=400682 RepID=A0AAN0JWV2_AMPQE|nr:PREDICTED: vesicle-associated membrane protein 3-like [Amphimedon queenslandica]|eukprot:XP_019861567.1 PREDICTED: vesicle-associated membrane protein 3-like [Amphimedon queenslandica]
MKDNIEKACARGDELNDLDVRAENLNEDAGLFQKQSTQLRRKYRNKNYKLWAILICIILIIVLAIAGVVAGLLGCHFHKNCSL